LNGFGDHPVRKLLARVRQVAVSVFDRLKAMIDLLNR
jgi:hypothetical protein